MGGFATVHLEATCGWPPSNDKSIHVFSYIVLAQFSANIRAGCVTATQCHTDQCNRQPTHFFPLNRYIQTQLRREIKIYAIF